MKKVIILGILLISIIANTSKCYAIEITLEQAEDVQNQINAITNGLHDLAVMVKRAVIILRYERQGRVTLTQEQRDALFALYTTLKNTFLEDANNLP